MADAGTYALIGAAALLGGMSRSTIAATVIVLEACGNNAYLLPLMITFAAAQYVGNLFNESMYDMQIELNQVPFLEETLDDAGLLTYHPVTEVMAKPVCTLKEVNAVKDVHELLSRTSHNGFPVVGEDGHLRGMILRKTLCELLLLKAFSTPTAGPAAVGPRPPPPLGDAGGGLESGADAAPHVISLTAGASVFYETLEKNYPNYHTIRDVSLSHSELMVRPLPSFLRCTHRM